MDRVKTQEPPGLSAAYQPIEDYAIIGALHTGALVGKNGSIGWCCIPRFDAPSVFGALLDAEKGGYFRIAPPTTPGISVKQLYIPDTNVLVTRFLTVDGVVEFTDFISIKGFGCTELEHYIDLSASQERCSPSFTF